MRRGIGPEEAETLPENELEQRVFGPAPPGKPPKLAPPDYAWVHTELKRHRHVTLQLLWEEYVERHGEATYHRSAFCEGYRRWERRLKRLMRQRHFAGEKLFVDYAGGTVPIYGVHGEESSGRSCSSGRSERAATRTRRRLAPRPCPTGSRTMYALWSSMGPHPSSPPITGR